MKPSTQNPATEPAVRILRSATCPSLSGKSKLSYEIGCTDGIRDPAADRGEQRVWFASATTGSTCRRSSRRLEKAPRGAPITSDALRPLFRGKSVNNQLFLFAVLKHEGLVRRSDGDKRGYERAEPGEFVKWTQALIEGKGATHGSRREESKTSRSHDEDEKANSFKEEAERHPASCFPAANPGTPS